jgi:hypothetical protein
MALPPAPSQYNFLGEDRIRKILELGINETIGRIRALESSPVTPPPPAEAALRFGLFAMGGRVGQGPGGDTGAPRYPIYYTNATPSGINAEIATAAAQGAWLVHIPSGSRGRWTHSDDPTALCHGPDGTPEGHFVWDCYEASVRRYVGNSTYANAVDQQKVLLYVADEPQIGTFGNSFSPELLNDAAMLHKEIWGDNAITLVRVLPSILQSGWDGNPPVDYTGIDYGWVQYSGFAHRNNETPIQHFESEKAAAAALNIGIVPSLNLWGAGIQHDFDGVTGCWDYRDDNVSNGVVQGSPAANGFTEGQQIPCATFTATLPNSSNVVASPNWIRHYADTMFEDPDHPFVLAWTWPTPASGASWGTTYIDRPDYAAALDYAINKFLTRPTANGLRTPKPWDGVPR